MATIRPGCSLWLWANLFNESVVITFVFASALGRGAVEQASATDWLNYCLSRRHSAVLDRQKQPIDTQHTARVSGKQSRSGPSIQTDRNVWHKVWLSNPTCSMPDCLSVHKLPRHSYMIIHVSWITLLCKYHNVEGWVRTWRINGWIFTTDLFITEYYNHRMNGNTYCLPFRGGGAGPGGRMKTHQQLRYWCSLKYYYGVE